MIPELFFTTTLAFVILNINVEYRGVKKASFIDGKEMLQFSTKKRYGLIWQSNIIIWALIAVVVGVVRMVQEKRNDVFMEFFCFITNSTAT